MQQYFDTQMLQLPFVVSDQQHQKLWQYLEALQKWNQAFNLTAIRDKKKMITHHLMDSLAVAPFVTSELIADVGTGAGLPGIPLAILFPEKSFHLVDSNVKKTRFVTQVAHQLLLKNVEVHHQRVEQLGIKVDQVISRAFASLADFINVTEHLLKDGGEFLAMKGKIPQTEIDLLPSDTFLVATEVIEVPGLDAERHLIHIKTKD